VNDLERAVSPDGSTTGPLVAAGEPGIAGVARLEHRPLTATAALVWSGDLPRSLQQILVDAADNISEQPVTTRGALDGASRGGRSFSGLLEHG
jgi:hypothetical protein